MGITDFVIVITNTFGVSEILKQLDNEEFFNDKECFISVLLDAFYSSEAFELTKGEYLKIPKTIHYCWFGENPIPDRLLKYMESWSKFFLDYEIMRWDESNYDIAKNKYMKEAYDKKMWAFVSDYARLEIIYNHGGVYLDTDVEIVKPFDDLLYDDMFCGFETNGHINFGLGFGAVKGHFLVKRIMDVYEDLPFINHDGSLNLTPCPVYQTAALKEHGFKIINSYQKIGGAALYPSEVMCPVNSLKTYNHLTDKTHSIHHFSATWVDDETSKKLQASRKQLEKILEARCKTNGEFN